MYLSRPARLLLRIGTAVTLVFLYAPLVVIAIYAFNPRRTLGWPTGGISFEWFDRAFHNPGLRDALLESLKAGLGATAIAVVLGTLAALAVGRQRFFGRETISFLVILPLALPGIVTGLRLATVSTVALVTVGAFIGQGGLGDLIMGGFWNNFYKAEIFTGTVLCVGLALIFDLALVGLGRLLTPWSRRRIS